MSPQYGTNCSLGITSFFADAPDAFSTPVRPARQKGEDNRTTLTADQSFSSVSTPDAIVGGALSHQYK
jgi:hypothetical protein